MSFWKCWNQFSNVIYVFHHFFSLFISFEPIMRECYFVLCLLIIDDFYLQFTHKRGELPFNYSFKTSVEFELLLTSITTVPMRFHLLLMLLFGVSLMKYIEFHSLLMELSFWHFIFGWSAVNIHPGHQISCCNFDLILLL